MEQRLGNRAAGDAGRGAEIFVQRGDRWVDVGWHLDNGPFQRKDEVWNRLDAPVPQPSR
jgi:hypothetical protein